MSPTLSAADQDLLRKIDLLNGLSDQDLSLVFAAARRIKVREGEYFFMQGDPTRMMYVLVQGRVKLNQITPDGQQVLLRIITPPALFGAVAITQRPVYPVSALAAEDSSAVGWIKEDLMKIVATIPQLALNALNFMAAQITDFQDQFRQLATERVERRLARVLLRLAGQTGKRVEEGVLIGLPLTRADLAEMIGATLYTVSRILSQWESQGLVVCGRERVVVRYPHGLVSIAEDLPDAHSGEATNNKA
jgi:CRP-like cAMP-binding protein